METSCDELLSGTRLTLDQNGSRVIGQLAVDDTEVTDTATSIAGPELSFLTSQAETR